MARNGLKSVQVKFENPEYNYSTSVNALSSEESLRKYFVGTSFDVASFPQENYQKCIDIVVDESQLTDVERAKLWWGSLSINEQKQFKIEALGEHFPNCSVHTKQGSNILKIYQTKNP